MPSAANIKMDKQITSETASVDSASNQQNTPIRQGIVIIEHKIRNLEKRKAKLESYRELQNSGKDLNQDQRVAVAKYDEVVQTLEFARDLCKQFQGIAVLADKDAKKVARKEAAARSQQELAKVREVLLVQDALAQFGQDTVRDDFLLGRNGAVTLTESDLKLLDEIYPEVSPKHEPGDVNFTAQVQAAAEHLLAVVDGKPKEIFGSSYSHIKEIIGKVHESGYFDQTPVQDAPVEFTEEPVAIVDVEVPVEVLPELPVDGPMPVCYVEATVPVEDVPLVAAIQQQAAVPQVIEQQFYQPPQASQPRPISEVLGTGTFFFLQDSELDSPEQVPQNAVIPNAAIPSQTFTNQNFVSMPPPDAVPGFAAANPPPLIPMPPSHLTGLEYGPMGGYPAYQPPEEMPQPVIQPLQAAVPPQLHPPADPAIIRNGNDDLVKLADEVHSGSPKNVPRAQRNSQRRSGPPPSAGYQQQQQQPYYQNNNGYAANNSRQRPGRGSGPRPGGGARAPTQKSSSKAAAAAAQQH
ncbi:Caprin [Carabus blaptoides fortunei]